MQNVARHIWCLKETNHNIHENEGNIVLFSALYSLEEDWTDVVGHESALGLDEKTRSQQTALWELVETEVAYIRTLKVIQDVSKIYMSIF